MTTDHIDSIQDTPSSSGQLMAPEHPLFGPAKRNNSIVYCLMLSAMIPGVGIFLAVAGIIASYVMKANEQDPVALTHFRWVQRTFWISLALGLLNSALLFLLPPLYFLGLAIVGIWSLYRYILGFVRLGKAIPMYHS